MNESSKEDWSLLTKKQKFGYWLIRVLGSLQKLVHEKLLGERMWKSADGRVTPISKMSHGHLDNCVRMLLRAGDQEGMLKDMLDEQHRRIFNGS